MSHHAPRLEDTFLTRRDLLRRCGMGFGAMAFGSLLGRAGASEINLNPLAVKAPHFAPKAKRIIHIFANGGASHVDSFDPKPALDQWHGREIPVFRK